MNKNEKRSETAKKAVVTMTKSEMEYINQSKRRRKSIIAVHHVGMPDIMTVDHKRRIKFYEIKPKKGNKKRTELNENQKKTFSLLLKSRIGQIFIVRWERHGKDGRFSYGKPEEIT